MPASKEMTIYVCGYLGLKENLPSSENTVQLVESPNRY